MLRHSSSSRPAFVRLVSRPCVRRARSSVGLSAFLAWTAFLPAPLLHAQTQILETHTSTLTTYQAGTTAAQGVKPLYTQRGVGLDGTLRAGAGMSWALAGNPYGSGGGGSSRIGDMDLATGAYAPFDVDWSGPAPGASRWVIGRSYNQLQASTSNGYQGKNWFQISQPEIVLYDADANSATKGDNDAVYVVYGADRYVEFDRTAADADTFKGKNGAAGVVEYVAGSAGTPPTLHTYVWTDQNGTRTYFFGDNTSFDVVGPPAVTYSVANFQLWKIVDAAGNTAYVGDKTTSATAATSGYNADKSIAIAYDGAENDGRRYSYTYSTIDSVSRLTQVKVETQSGGTWATTPSNIKEIVRVNYEYYTGSDAQGPNGSLKIAAVRTSLTDSNSTMSNRTDPMDPLNIFSETKKHYRYYTEEWADSDGRRGNIGDLKMVVDKEGCRRYDWTDSILFDQDQDAVRDSGEDDFLGASDSALMAYSAAYFEYPSGDHKPSKGTFNGECGCTGGTNGSYEFTYATNSGFSATSGYDTAWLTRTVVTQPDTAWVTQYFDEVAQPLSRVVTDTDPSGSPSKFWATEVVRNSSGQVTEVHSSGNITAYTHTNGSVAYTRSPTAGLITFLDRTASGDMTGFHEATYLKKGTGGTAEFVAYTGYTSKDYKASGWGSTVKVIRPLVGATRAFHTSGTSSSTTANYHETTLDYTVWGSVNTDVKNVAIKTVTTTLPTVTTANNGPNSAATMVRYLREDQTTAFAMESALSSDAKKYSYTKLNANGQVVLSVADATTNQASYFDKDPLTDFGITEDGLGINVETMASATYDAQGRPDTAVVRVVGNTTKTTKSYYSRLKDGRMVSIQFHKFTAGSPPTAYGPASYGVSNHAGKSEMNGTIAISSSGSATALTAWIDENDSDPITALDAGTLARMSTSIYSESGSQLQESRTYTTIPASGAGSSGTNYLATTFAYDAMGRRKKTVDPTGTITATTFDTLGRTLAHKIGTNDGGAVGVDNMVTTDETTYDDVTTPSWVPGSGHVTKRTQFVEGSTTGQRETNYASDYRGRMLLQTNAVAPHVLNKYDNLNRVIASGQYSSAPSSTADPTSTTSNRVAFSETSYDQQGRAYKTTRHKITQSNGNMADSIDSNTWFDAMGRVLKTKGEGGISKSIYDRLGRATNRFVIGSDGGETAYTDVDDVSGDTVLEESQTYFDDKTGLALMHVQISRHHTDTTTTTALDTDTDLSLVDYSGSKIKGRVQISTTFYDDLGRAKATAMRGTAGGSNYDRDTDGTTVPTRSSTILVTSTTFNDDGTVLEVESPGTPGNTAATTGIKTRYAYDQAGRKITEIRNYAGVSTPITTANRDSDLYTRYAYSTTGLMTAMWVDIKGDDTTGVPPSLPLSGDDVDDQITFYTYGTTKGTSAGDSKIATGHLLQKVTYPDSSSGTDVVTFAYNAQSQQMWTKDQAGNVIETDYDTAGRQTHRRATTVISGFDGTIKRISMAYLSRGPVDTVTQYDNATVGSGTAKDQVQYSYDDWGNLSKFEQDVDSTISGGSGRAAFDIEYTWAKNATPTYAFTTLARGTMTLPNGETVLSLFDTANRVTSLKWNSTTYIASYQYLGAGMLVGTTLDEPNVFSNLYAAGSPTSYGNLDRFNRVLTINWTNGISGGTDFYHVDLSYDNLGNIMTAKDTIHADTSGVRRFDASYSMDALSRLTRAEEGNWDGSSISTRRRDEQWKDDSTLKLSQTGNWLRHKLNLNNDSDFTDAGEIDDTGTFNAANEWLTRDTDTNGTANYTLTHDAVGNMTDDGKNYTYVYDAFGRLMTVKNRGTSAVVAEYKYNGLGYRTGWHYDHCNSGCTSGPDGSVTADDPWIYFQYDERWRVVATWRASDGFVKEQYIHHAAGARGLGGSSYIDSVILRDRDPGAWTAGTADEMTQRRYYCQNWRADVSVILPSTGCSESGPGILEWIKYSAYGVPQAFSMADYNRDGAANATDFNGSTGDFDVDYGAGDPRADLNFDGGVTSDDFAIMTGAASEAASRGTQSCASTANRIGYAGYVWDPVVSVNHVRHRVYVPELGRWTRRDPLGYVDGMSLYEYVASMPIDSVDPEGLECRRYNRCSDDGPVNPPSGGTRGDRRRDPPVGGVEPGPTPVPGPQQPSSGTTLPPDADPANPTTPPSNPSANCPPGYWGVNIQTRWCVNSACYDSCVRTQCDFNRNRARTRAHTTFWACMQGADSAFASCMNAGSCPPGTPFTAQTPGCQALWIGCEALRSLMQVQCRITLAETEAAIDIGYNNCLHRCAASCGAEVVGPRCPPGSFQVGSARNHIVCVPLSGTPGSSSGVSGAD